ncbi:glycosyltransferase family 39 protein [Candidatus Poribacteria bacterium]|nr:glycosyltransferase family 39 protein [Candidatus Poribacteria bacterium]
MIFESSNAKNQSVLIKIILLCILITSFVLVLRNLGHSKIHYWDEGFHAMVARNLTKHPLKFTLYDQPWLEYNYKSWGENHIWLHKPPVAMWKICLSHFIFGINAFALRLPSAISLAVSAWLTYRIASDLFDKRAGLIAAFLQAFNPFLFESVHGYRFSDHIDIALLLWVQVSCWFLLRAIRTGKRRNYILSGIAMGIAYLSKSYLALITFGIALVVWFVAWYKRRSQTHDASTDEPATVEVQESDYPISGEEDARIRLSDVGLQLLAGILTVVPWATYCLIKYPQEFIWEHKRVIDHLNTNVENWAASWDRPLFEYMPLFYPFFYAALFAVVLCLLVMMFKRWRLPELFVLAWAIGVIVPHTLAQTKTPSATMIAVPPLLICMAAVISRAWQRRDWLYTAIWGASMLSIVTITAIAAKTKGNVQIRNMIPIDGIRSFAPFIHKHFWIIEQLIVFSVLLAFFVGIYLISKREWQRWIWLGVRIVALVIAVFYAGRYVHAAYRVTERNAQIPLYVESGKRIQRELPENVCFFLDDERTGAHFDLMYYADRSTYQINNVHMKAPRNVARQAREARAAGAIPYLFSLKQTKYSYPLLIEDEIDVGNGKKQRYRIYEITETQ